MPIPRRSLLLLLALPAVLTGSASASTASPRIVGGTPSAPTAWPAQVEVRQSHGLGLGSLCGGTLVARRFVVTAGHCVRQGGLIGGSGPVAGAENFTVLVGSNTAGRGTALPVIGVAAHPGFPAGGNRFPFDVAVLGLAVDAAPPALPITDPATDAGTYEPGVMAKAIGFGLTSNGGSGSPTLLETDLPIVGDGPCGEVFGSTLSPEVQICAGQSGGRDVCQGDSGGPLMTVADGVHKLTGITSFGRAGGCGQATPSVFTDITVDSVRSFVFGITGQPPTVAIGAGAAFAGAPVTITADARDTEGGIAAYAWDLDGNGTFEGPATPTATVTRAAAGVTKVRVRVTDAAGMVAVTERDVTFAKPPKAKVTVSASRRPDGRLRVRGRVRGKGCSLGAVSVRAVPPGGRTVRKEVELGKSCRFSVRLKVRSRARVTVRFEGTPALRAASRSVRKRS